MQVFLASFLPLNAAQVQHETSYLLEHLYQTNLKLAVLVEVALPWCERDSPQLSWLYAVCYNLRQEVVAAGAVEGFTKFLPEIEKAFLDYYDVYASLAGSLTLEQMAHVAPEAEEFSVAHLLQVPLAEPLIWANIAARLRRKSADARLDPIVNFLSGVFARLCLADKEAKSLEDQMKRSLQGELRPEKKGFLQMFHRKPRAVLDDAPRSFFGRFENVRMVLPRQPNVVQDVRIVCFSDAVLILARDRPLVLFRMDPQTVVVSTRHTPDVQEAVSSREGSFALFCDRGRGKVEQIVLFPGSFAACHLIMSRIHACSLLRLNAGRVKVLTMLARERKPMQGRSSDLGTEYHFAVYSFGIGAVTRHDTGPEHVLISTYKSRELEKFAPLPSPQHEQRVRATFSTEEFDVASFGLSSVMLLLKHVALHREETQVRLRGRMRQPLLSITNMTRAEQVQLRRTMEEEAQRKAALAVQKHLHGRLGDIQNEYNGLSLELYKREQEVRELQARLAEKSAPPLDVVKREMTPLEQLEFREKQKEDETTSVEFSE